MQQYIKDYMKSRGYIEGDYMQCEINGCGRQVEDVHHIFSSHRGKRKHASDGSDLIGLCRHHHEQVHAKNNFEMRELLHTKALRAIRLAKRK